MPVLASKRNCIDLIGEIDPRKYTSHNPIKTDGRGRWVPPIGSKLFIAWRGRTPPHIPDSAYFLYWAKPSDIRTLLLEAQTYNDSDG